MTAKQMIARFWKMSALCTLATKHRVTQAMIHTKIKATLKDRVQSTQKPGGPGWINYFPLTLMNFS